MIAYVWPSTSAARCGCASSWRPIASETRADRPLLLRLVRLLLSLDLEQSKKGQAIRELVRREFEKGRDETDPEKVEALKAKCVRSPYT